MTEQLLYLPAPRGHSPPEPPIVYAAAKPTPVPPPRDPWVRQFQEPNVWFVRFRTNYLPLGPRRNVTQAAQAAGTTTRFKITKWQAAAALWHWKDRAEAWDAHLLDLELERREEILKTGLALDHERVFALKEIGAMERDILLALAQAVADDPTSGKSGKLAARYGQFKTAYDNTLKAIAEEVGGRAKKINIHAELETYAITVAREQGYDEATARSFARIVEQEAKNSS